MKIAAAAFVGMWLAGTMAGGGREALADEPPAWAAAARDTHGPHGAVSAVATKGKATLKLCRNWLIKQHCREYGVDIPTRVAVGDSFEVTFGSNPKTMQFRVKNALLRGKGGGCLIVPAHERTPKNPSPDAPADMLIVKDCTVER